MKKFITAHKEALKNILLIALVFLMAVQTIYTWSYGLNMNAVPDNSIFVDFFKGLGYNKDGKKISSASMEAASFPVQAMVQGKRGLYGVQYNENGVGVVFDKTKKIWKDAFNNAGKFKASSESNFRAALTKPFIFLKYDGAVPVQIIAGWLGSDYSDSGDTLFAESVLLSRADKNDYYLYVRDAKTGFIFEFKTEIYEDEFLSEIDGFISNNCELAMNSGEEFQKFLPETMIFDTPMAFDVLKCEAPSFVSQQNNEGIKVKDSTRRLLEAFYYNPYTSKRYEEAGGNIQNYVENFRTLRIETNGRIRFEASDIRGGIEAFPRGKMSGRDADMQCIELGRSITQNAIASMAESKSSDGQVALTKWYYSPKTNTNVAVFSVRYGGIPIDSSESGFFARYEFRGNMMIRAVLNMRQYSKDKNAKQLYVLPERQLAAAVTNTEAVGICVRYEDNGKDRCIADWKLNSKIK